MSIRRISTLTPRFPQSLPLRLSTRLCTSTSGSAASGAASAQAAAVEVAAQGTTQPQIEKLAKTLVEVADEPEPRPATMNPVQLPQPVHPSELQPAFERVKRTAKMVRVVEGHDDYAPTQKDNYVKLPPPEPHPWVKGQVVGPHIVHGDGNFGIVGHGEVGFSDSLQDVNKEFPKQWLGFKHIVVTGQTPTQQNGFVNENLTIKHSIKLTGRGMFANKEIPAGEPVMNISSVASSMGYNTHRARLLEMARDVILDCKAMGPDGKQYLHHWILTCQPSSLLEHLPESEVTEVVESVGGEATLAELEIHRCHIPRLAAIIDLNNFLIESPFQEERGMAYWPEAAFFNHSCVPNATYDIIPDVKRPGKYMFQVVATQTIAPGEEILISYVPSSWRFDDRQYVLRDRYRFWCKCPKCAPTIDKRSRKWGYFVMLIAFVYCMGQMWVVKLRYDTRGRDEEMEKKGELHRWKHLYSS